MRTIGHSYAIRAVNPSTPILIFGGHSHIRDCVQLDGRSMALQSGRYMETLGWMSANLNENDSDNITFSRRYLDPNRVTYQVTLPVATRLFSSLSQPTVPHSHVERHV